MVMNRIITFLVLAVRYGDRILTSKTDSNKGEKRLVLFSIIFPNFDTDLISRTIVAVLWLRGDKHEDKSQCVQRGRVENWPGHQELMVSGPCQRRAEWRAGQVIRTDGVGLLSEEAQSAWGYKFFFVSYGYLALCMYEYS